MGANRGDRSARTGAVVLVLLCVLVVVASAGCGGGDASEVPQRFAPLAQAVEAERVSLGAPGVAVAVVEKGQVTFAKGFGSKDPTAAAGAPVEPTTLFRIGSTQKALTAIALLQTVQAGAVDLDRPITSYLPSFHLSQTPEPVSQITARHLLTHTSGIHDYLEIAAPPGETTDAALAGFLTGRYADIGYVQSPPGAFYAYSNPGYMLAGLIAETMTGMPYRQLVHDRVLATLGMNRTFFLPRRCSPTATTRSGARAIRRRMRIAATRQASARSCTPTPTTTRGAGRPGTRGRRCSTWRSWPRSWCTATSACSVETWPRR